MRKKPQEEKKDWADIQQMYVQRTERNNKVVYKLQNVKQIYKTFSKKAATTIINLCDNADC